MIINSFSVPDSQDNQCPTGPPLSSTMQQFSDIIQISLRNYTKVPQLRRHTVENDLPSPRDSKAGIYYSPLGTDKFRLLEILPGEDNIIETKLHVCNMAGNATAYEALSYTWGGNQASEGARLSIEANGAHQIVDVSRNLHCALLALRQSDTSRTIWADAICINQEDVIERGRQVSMMGAIYSNAHRVIIWLGDDSDSCYCGKSLLEDSLLSTSMALTFICSIVNEWLTRNDERDVQATYSRVLGNGKSVIVYDKDKQTSGLQREHRLDQFSVLALFGRPWFSRVWVIQESVLARRALVQLGPYQIEWEWIGIAAAIILHSPLIRIDGLCRERIPNGVTNAYLMYRLSSSQSRFPALSLTFAELLRATQSFKCKEERDKIYGLIGIQTTDAVNAAIVPDYCEETKMEKIYEDVAWLLLQSKSPLTLLSSVGAFHNREGCRPGSWIPHWGQNQPWTILPNQPHPRFQCALNRPASIARNGSTTQLIVSGVIVDQVKKTWNFQNLDVPADSLDQAWEKAQHFLSQSSWSQLDWQKCALSLSCGGDGRGYPVYDIDTHLADLAATVFSPHWRSLMPKLLAFETVVKSRVHLTTQFDFLTERAINGNLNRYLGATAPLHNDYKPFATDWGFFGVGPAPMMDSDILCVIFGAAVPFILRLAQDGYQIVGECYVFDIMHGEVSDMCDSSSPGSLKSTLIKLV